ncbi:uncharacterized protein ACNS7B_022744 isoform 4-T4 [Menidia menidia]
MGAVWILCGFVLTAVLAKGTCLPVVGKNHGNANELQKLQRVSREANDVKAALSLGNLKSSKVEMAPVTLKSKRALADLPRDAALLVAKPTDAAVLVSKPTQVVADPTDAAAVLVAAAKPTDKEEEVVVVVVADPTLKPTDAAVAAAVVVVV